MLAKLKNINSNQSLEFLLTGTDLSIDGATQFELFPLSYKAACFPAFQQHQSPRIQCRAYFSADAQVNAGFKNVLSFLKGIDKEILSNQIPPLFSISNGVHQVEGYLQNYLIHVTKFNHRGEPSEFFVDLSLMETIKEGQNNSNSHEINDFPTELNRYSSVKSQIKNSQKEEVYRTEPEKRKALENWYQSDPKLTHKPKTIHSHMSGVDYTQPVIKKTLPTGTPLIQYGYIGGAPGGYCAHPGTSANAVAVSSAPKVLRKFRTTEPMTVIESTAAPFPESKKFPGIGGKGGGKQLHMPPDWQSKVRSLN